MEAAWPLLGLRQQRSIVGDGPQLIPKVRSNQSPVIRKLPCHRQQLPTSLYFRAELSQSSVRRGNCFPSIQVRFIAPGSMVANVDYVESVFGNAGEASLPENDAGLDPIHWSGQTGSPDPLGVELCGSITV